MDEQKKLRVILSDKAESMFFDILKNNSLEENREEIFNKLKQGEETKEMIVRDAVRIMAKKIISENKISELLQKHIEISKESAENLVKDIKNKLLPLLLIYPEEKFNDPVFREEVSKKVFGDEKKVILPFVKKVEVPDVEKNAEKIKKERKPISSTLKENKISQEISQENKKDPYKEPVE